MVDGKTKRQHNAAPRERRRRSGTRSGSDAKRRTGVRRTVGNAAPPFSWRAVCYISCRDPALGPASLKAQMQATDAAVAALPAVVMTRYVDSGSWLDGRGIGFALDRLEAEAAAGGFDVVVVEHISRFASDYAAALRFALDLARTGVRIVEARGGPVTIDPLAILPDPAVLS